MDGGSSDGTLDFVSVVIVTHNPNRELLSATLHSIECQDFPIEGFEVILVDNASSPALEAKDFAGRNFRLRLIAEPNLGLIWGRCSGIEAASGGLIVFVDDDNQIARDYLAQAVRIARKYPEIGAFGGICEALFAAPPAKWKDGLLRYLGIRNHGSEPITSNSGNWGPWDPIGAGMVVRHEVAQRFVEFVKTNRTARRLGRAGKSMMSGEDTLMARMAWMMNYFCSYQPSLRLLHYMKPERLRLRSLARTVAGHGRSYIVLEEILGRVPADPLWLLPIHLPASYLSRIRAEGLRAGSIAWLWDLGRALELVAVRKRVRNRLAGERGRVEAE